MLQNRAPPTGAVRYASSRRLPPHLTQVNTSNRPVASDAQCASWDSSRLTWGVVGTMSGALGAAGGSVALLTDLVEDRGAQLALGLTSVLLGR